MNASITYKSVFIHAFKSIAKFLGILLLAGLVYLLLIFAIMSLGNGNITYTGNSSGSIGILPALIFLYILKSIYHSIVYIWNTIKLVYFKAII